MQALIFLKVKKDKIEDVVSSVKKSGNVESIFILEDELLLKASFVDVDELTRYLKNLRAIRGIERTETKLVLKKFSQQEI